jgi:Xaa-Pro aminopeptidase
MVEMTVLDKRLARLREGMEREQIDVALISRPQHVFYFSGVMPGSAPVLLMVTPERELAIAPAPLGDIETFIYRDYDIQRGWNVSQSVGELLDRAISSNLPLEKNVGLELDHLQAAWMPVILKHLREPRDLKELLWKVRRLRDETELLQIQTNIAGNDRMFEEVRAMLRPGISELDVWAVIQKTLNENAGEPVRLEADLGAGLRGSGPDAKPGKEILKAGEAVFIDVYSATHHYYADTTRVLTLGTPDDRQKQIHAVLRAAMDAGEKQLQPGTPANRIDAAVRGIISAAGFGENFPHHSGHAYSIFQQDKPYFIPAERTPVEAGMVVTLEPGIYIPGWGGMRIESNFLIESDGPRRLDQYPLDITIC